MALQPQYHAQEFESASPPAAPAPPVAAVPWLLDVGSIEDLERELIAYASSGDECPNPSPFATTAPAVDWQWLAASLQQDPMLAHDSTAHSAFINMQDDDLQHHHQPQLLQNSFGVVPTHGGAYDAAAAAAAAAAMASGSGSGSDEDSGHMSDASARGGFSVTGSSPSSSFPDLGEGEEEEEDGEDGEDGESYVLDMEGGRKPFSQPRPFSRKTRGNFLANLTDEERVLLAEEGYEFPEHEVLTKEEERRLKSLRRKIKNKLSAQDSRKKKKEYTNGLEGRVKACTAQNKELKTKVQTLEAENRTLLDQLREMKASLERFGRNSTKKGTAILILSLCFAFFLNPGAAPSAAPTAAGPAFTPSFKSRTLMGADDSAAAAQDDVAPTFFGYEVPAWLADVLSTQPGEIPPSFADPRQLEELLALRSGASGYSQKSSASASASASFDDNLGGAIPTVVPPVVRPEFSAGSVVADEAGAFEEEDGEEDEEGEHKHKRNGAGSRSLHRQSAAAAAAAASWELSGKPLKRARMDVATASASASGYAQHQQHQPAVAVNA